MRAYLLVYGDSLGTRDEVMKILDSLLEVTTWRYDMPHSFYIVSERSAEELSKAIRSKVAKAENPRFLVTEISENRQGYLTKESWHLVLHKRHLPKT